MRRLLPVAALVVVVAASAFVASLGGRSSAGASATLPAPQPTLSDFAQLTSSPTPPTEAQCFTANSDSGGRRCFTPQSIRAAYNVPALTAATGVTGAGQTIAVIDSFGSDTMAHDLHVFDQAFGVQTMCGEEGVTGASCTPGMPTFSELSIQGSPATKANPGKSPGLQDRSAWAIEVALDVEWAHSVAPGANILLVHTPVAETLGVQGFPAIMKAEDYVVKNHLATVISQSLAAAEESFGSPQSLLNLRYAFQDAAANGVTVLGSTGDSGTANSDKKSIVGNPNHGPDGLIPYPTVEWPASDPLVTAVGGTYLCTDPAATAGRVTDSADFPTTCQNNPGVTEIGWIDSGGGFSHIFPRPPYQDVLPAGPTVIPADSRGIPDVAYQASSRTGVLVYVTLPPNDTSGAPCGPAGSAPCSTGWYIVGGTSAGSPQWAGLVALADQLNGGGLGPINAALYKIAANPAQYASDFYDVTTGNNTAVSSVPGYPATTGWDPVTGLGTPNAAKLIPDLVAAVNAP